MPLAEGTENGCKALAEGAENKDVVVFLDMFQLPKSCPVEAVSSTRAALTGKPLNTGQSF